MMTLRHINLKYNDGQIRGTVEEKMSNRVRQIIPLVIVSFKYRYVFIIICTPAYKTVIYKFKTLMKDQDSCFQELVCPKVLIYAAHFLELFDIYKYGITRFQTMFMP